MSLTIKLDELLETLPDPFVSDYWRLYISSSHHDLRDAIFEVLYENIEDEALKDGITKADIQDMLMPAISLTIMALERFHTGTFPFSDSHETGKVTPFDE